MAERQSGESSVVISLAELMKLDEQRRAEVVAHERERVVEAERRAAEEAEQTRAAVAARTREEALRTALDEAHIEAAKAAHLEKARLEVQVRVAAEQAAAREAHARELASMLENTREKRSRGTLALAILAAVAAVVAVTAVWFATQQKPAPVAIEPPKAAAPSTHDQTMKEIEALRAELDRVKNLSAPAPSPSPSHEVAKPRPIEKKPAIKPGEPAKKVDCTGIPYCPGQ